MPKPEFVTSSLVANYIGGIIFWVVLWEACDYMLSDNSYPWLNIMIYIMMYYLLPFADLIFLGIFQMDFLAV